MSTPTFAVVFVPAIMVIISQHASLKPRRRLNIRRRKFFHYGKMLRISNVPILNFIRTGHKWSFPLIKKREYFCAWLAAFWEGEGCFSIKSGTRVSIGQSGNRGLEILKKIRGFLKTKNIKSSIYKGDRGPRHKIMWGLRISSKRDILLFFDLIIPHMQFRTSEIIPKLDMVRKKRNINQWTKEELEFVKVNYGKIPVNKIKDFVKHNNSEISRQAIRHGCPYKQMRWTLEEEAILISLSTKPLKIAATKLGRSYRSVNLKKQQLRRRGLLANPVIADEHLELFP